MTTTTVERRALRLAPLAAALASLLAAPSCWADWRFTPSLNIVETYTDNVDLRSGSEKHSDLISEVAPGLSLMHDSRRLKVSAQGSLRQFFYLKEASARNRNERFVQYDADLSGILAEDLLYVDASASAGRQSTSAFGPRAEERPYSNLNGTEFRTWRISPYLMQKFGRSARATLRYTRDSVESDQRNRFGDSLADTVTASLDSLPGAGKLGWGVNYNRQDLEQEFAGESSSENVSGRLRYQLVHSFALTANLGYDRYDYQALGGRTAGRNWSTGFSWTPSQRTTIEASIGRHFFGTTGSLLASVRSRKTVWLLSYSDAITNSRSQFTLPSAIDTAAMLDRLFLASIPDPVQRRQAVEAYIQASGLPPSLADSVNYLTNRYIRQKQLQGSAAFRGRRSSAVLSAYGNERIALSSQETDSALLGSQLASLNDNVRQYGASANATYRLSQRSSLVGSADFSRSESISTGLESRQRLLRLAFNTKLGRDLRGSLELRRRRGDTDPGNGSLALRSYTENAIAATLFMQL
ncbi:TIGR03016 family PEP-CTERM system-associated outer membrane protein [Massilia agri]|uniref:TIGR03016 family PEP-CTERM system-associated outer membrane protein n=1 Tax=Massilia agri TaxID=1886785 RepID=A0ABT2AIK2_9BURK|nr:TIGR03016 family PEP-CTERM system-associated outer membrane protein [Massilia agri]MCS0595608.1 TIGR03016 family PEP-CTERM system-associated outer membrane protein [Massilia agri]